MKNKYYFLYILIFIFILFGLTSCKKESDKIIIESFDYEINRNKSTVANELSYTLSFDIDFSLNQKVDENDLVVRIAASTEAILQDKSFRLDIDYCNTENVTVSPSTAQYPYILLKYAMVDVTTLNVNAQIKITSNDLIDDINHFIKIDCYSDSKEIVDKNNLLNNDIFKMNYSDISLIYYEFDEFSESYKLVSVMAESDTFEIPAIYKGYPVKTIGEGAFYGCSSIKSISISDNVTSIEKNAFEGCSSLTSITIPNSVKSIEEAAFRYCSGLISIKIPESVTSIGFGAFYGCSSLTSITIPNSVISIGNAAFSGCHSLTSIIIPNSVTSIGDGTFQFCRSLTSITIPNSVRSIGGHAFRECSSLTSITMGNSVTIIEGGAFLGCNSLKEVYYNGTATEWNSIDINYHDNEALTGITIYLIH